MGEEIHSAPMNLAYELNYTKYLMTGEEDRSTNAESWHINKACAGIDVNSWRTF